MGAAPLSDGRAELGPVLPPSLTVHGQALELLALARRAEEFSRAGQSDLPLAMRQLEQMRAILGPGHDPAAAERPRCGCPQIVVERVNRGGTCGRGGCPYGGDF
jgi:hypothetical protein